MDLTSTCHREAFHVFGQRGRGTVAAGWRGAAVEQVRLTTDSGGASFSILSSTVVAGRPVEIGTAGAPHI